MAEKKRIGLLDIKGLGPNSEIWDTAVPGFGARRQQSSAIAYVVLFRTVEGRSRRYTIGRHGAPWTPEQARQEAKRLLGAVASGRDPADEKHNKRHAVTVSELCDLYYKDCEAGRVLTRRRVAKKESTLLSDKSRIDSHIKPLLGRMKVATVTSRDVENFMHQVEDGKTAKREKTGKARGLSNVRGGRGAASRTVGLLGGIFTYAKKHNLCTENPVHSVDRPADGQYERRLTDAEYLALGEGLRLAYDAEIWPAAIEATRFLAYSGWRRSEVLKLRWDEFNLDKRTAWLPDTKTGRSRRPLSQKACVVLAGMEKLSDLVFPPTYGTGLMSGFDSMFRRIMDVAGLPPAITSKTFRHSFISLGSDLGLSMATIGELVGHKQSGVTARYIHPADVVVLAAADAVTNRTTALMGESVLLTPQT
jgi:integrase